MEAFKRGSTSALVAVGVVVFLLAVVVPSDGLKCYQCGQYTDGVGSITPCINHTEALHLKDCPKNKQHCIKYVSEGSTVRDCEAKCTEKDAWGTKIYCCDEDGCNNSDMTHASRFILVAVVAIAAIRNISY